MITVRTSAWIPGPVEEVFAFFDDLDNLLEFNQWAQRIDRAERLEDGRLVYQVTMLASNGKEFTISGEQLERRPPHRLVMRSSTSELTILSERDFAPEHAGTRVTMTFSSQHRRRIVGRILEWLQRDGVRLEAEASLQAVAQRFASRPHPNVT